MFLRQLSIPFVLFSEFIFVCVVFLLRFLNIHDIFIPRS
nr:MAG TPA: hypothetical protein [Caudoviricetes sp.]